MLFDLLKKVISNNDGKALISNIGYLSILQIASYVFPLITMPYLAKTIGPEGFGKIAFAAAVIVWFETITEWGFHFSATRDIAKCRDDIDSVNYIFFKVFWSRCVLMLISICVLVVFILCIPQFRESYDVLLITALLIPGKIIFPDWFFQAMERMKYITYLSLLSRLFFTLAVFVFIKDSDDYILQPLLNSLGMIVSGCISLYIIKKQWKLRLLIIPFKEILSSIKDGADLFINQLAPNLYNSFSTILLGFYGGANANGILDAGMKLVMIFQRFLVVFSRAFFPFLSRKSNKHGLYAKFSVAISSGTALLLFVFAPYLISFFFTEEFNTAIVVLRICAFGILFMNLNDVYGTNYLIVNGYERSARNITLLSSILGFVVSIPLVYYFSYIGAAITITLSRGFLGIGAYFKYNSIKKIIKE